MATRASPPKFSPTAMPELSTAIDEQHRLVSLGRKPIKKDPNKTRAIQLKCVICKEKAGHYCAAASCTRGGGKIGVCSNMKVCLSRHMEASMHEAGGATTPKGKRKAQSPVSAV